MLASARVLALLLTCSTAALAGNWPAWRGPQGDGHADARAAPLTWDPTRNVRWKVPLPLPGNSSPVVWGERVFLTQALDQKGRRRALLCLDRKDGKKRWEQVVTYAGGEPTHATNPYASASPVTDGEWVIALRCARVDADGTLVAYAGAGIVADSDPESELAETRMKFRPIADALR